MGKCSEMGRRIQGEARRLALAQQLSRAQLRQALDVVAHLHEVADAGEEFDQRLRARRNVEVS